jgi:hypothetical protein
MNQTLHWTLSRVAVFDRHRIYVLAYSDHEPGTRVFRWTDKWDNYYVRGISAGICAVRSNQPEILTLCADGRVHRAAPDGQSYESLVDDPPSKNGLLRDIRCIGDSIYVAGFGRQIYQRNTDRSWQHCDHGVVEDPKAESLSGFESIDGFHENELYAVGNLGEIWCRHENQWRKIESPTNIILENVLCAPDGVVYISGQLGILLRGRRNSWELIEHELTEDTFWDMTWFDNKLWLSTSKALYSFANDRLEQIDTGIGAGQTFRYLDATPECLCSSGERHLAIFDGKAWTLIPNP